MLQSSPAKTGTSAAIISIILSIILSVIVRSDLQRYSDIARQFENEGTLLWLDLRTSIQGDPREGFSGQNPENQHFGDNLLKTNFLEKTLDARCLLCGKMLFALAGQGGLAVGIVTYKRERP